MTCDVHEPVATTHRMRLVSVELKLSVTILHVPLYIPTLQAWRSVIELMF